VVTRVESARHWALEGFKFALVALMMPLWFFNYREAKHYLFGDDDPPPE